MKLFTFREEIGAGKIIIIKQDQTGVHEYEGGSITWHKPVPASEKDASIIAVKFAVSVLTAAWKLIIRNPARCGISRPSAVKLFRDAFQAPAPNISVK
jgi:hypothetical protein